MFLPGIAKDLDIPFTDMTPEKAINALASRKGRLHLHATECKDSRWGSFIDHCQSWDAEWHLEAMVQLYSQWEAGMNPWTGQAAPDQAQDDERTYSILKLRWQVL